MGLKYCPQTTQFERLPYLLVYDRNWDECQESYLNCPISINRTIAVLNAADTSRRDSIRWQQRQGSINILYTRGAFPMFSALHASKDEACPQLLYFVEQARFGCVST